MSTRISVITATYNCVNELPGCLESMARQTHAKREHIVIDGASSDGTLGLLQRHSAQFSTLISEPDGGIYDALNKGVAQAQGDVIGFLHGDDAFANDQVLARVSAAFDDPRVSMVYGDLQYVRRQQTDEVVRHWAAGPFVPSQLRAGWMPPHPTVYLRREVYERLGNFDTQYRIAADYDHMLRVFGDSSLHCAYLPEVLIHMRTGGISNRSLGSVLRKSAEDLHILRHHQLGGLASLLMKNLRKIKQLRPGQLLQRSARRLMPRLPAPTPDVTIARPLANESSRKS